MVSSDRVEQVTAAASPPHPRVVGFCANSSAETSNDTMSVSPHSVIESPLSQMLRTATWPCLRVRLGKNEISRPLALASQSHCSTSPKLMLHARSVSQHSISSSPISIPRACRLARMLCLGPKPAMLASGCSMFCAFCSWIRDADSEGDALLSSPAGVVSHLMRGVVQTSDSPKVCKATTGHTDLEGGDFAEACWRLE